MSTNAQQIRSAKDAVQDFIDEFQALENALIDNSASKDDVIGFNDRCEAATTARKALLDSLKLLEDELEEAPTGALKKDLQFERNDPNGTNTVIAILDRLISSIQSEAINFLVRLLQDFDGPSVSHQQSEAPRDNTGAKYGHRPRVQPADRAASNPIDMQMATLRAFRKFQLPSTTFDIAKFNGDPSTFREFWSQFQEYDDDPVLRETEKMKTLLGALSSKVREKFAMLELSPVNYRVLKNKLFERYDIHHSAENALFQKIDKLPLRESEQGNDLATFEKMDMYVAQLEAINYNIDETKFFHDVLKRIPHEIFWRLQDMDLPQKTSAYMRAGSKIYSKLSTWARDSIWVQGGNTSRCSMPSSSKSQFANSGQKQSTRMCVFCSKHPVNIPCTIKDIAKRKRILVENKRCFKCLKPGHRVTSCTGGRGCRKCGSSEHHRSICVKKTETGDNQTRDNKRGRQNRAAAKQVGSAVSNDANSSAVSKDAATLATSRQVLLVTPSTAVRNATNTRIFIDTGSQLSFITGALAGELQLEPERVLGQGHRSVPTADEPGRVGEKARSRDERRRRGRRRERV